MFIFHIVSNIIDNQPVWLCQKFKDYFEFEAAGAGPFLLHLDFDQCMVGEPIVKDFLVCLMIFKPISEGAFEHFRLVLCLAPVYAVKCARDFSAHLIKLSTSAADRSGEDRVGMAVEGVRLGSRHQGSANGTRVAWPGCRWLGRTLLAIYQNRRTSGTSWQVPHDRLPFCCSTRCSRLPDREACYRVYVIWLYYRQFTIGSIRSRDRLPQSYHHWSGCTLELYWHEFAGLQLHGGALRYRWAYYQSWRLTTGIYARRIECRSCRRSRQLP